MTEISYKNILYSAQGGRMKGPPCLACVILPDLPSPPPAGLLLTFPTGLGLHTVKIYLNLRYVCLKLILTVQIRTFNFNILINNKQFAVFQFLFNLLRVYCTVYTVCAGIYHNKSLILRAASYGYTLTCAIAHASSTLPHVAYT